MPSFAAAVLVFLASAAILILEILAGRLLAPYVGVTLETFTGIIGVILAGIALGSWVGGRLADRLDPRRLLGPELVLGGILALVSIPVVDFLGSGLRGGTPVTIVALALFGFFAPAAVLAAVTPTVVKLQLADLGRTGRVVGRLSAIGTAGALFGTFTTGFLLVAALPTRPIIRILGGALIVLGLAVWGWLRSPRSIGVATVIGALLAGAFSFAAANPCERETAYSCAFVEVDANDPSGRVLWLDTLRNSWVDLEDPTNLGPFTYAKTMSDIFAAIAPAEQPLDVLHVGGAGFTLPRYLRATRPGTHSTVLELDRELVDLAIDELGLELRDDIEVKTGDARLTLRDIETNSKDLVVGDAFSGVAVPWHLTTKEFLEDVERVLRPDGVYAMNLIDYGSRDFARAQAATLTEVFEHVTVLAPPGRLEFPGEGGNFVMIASNEPLPVSQILARNDERGDDETSVSGEEFAGDAQVLTDDHAPVDQLITPRP